MSTSRTEIVIYIKVGSPSSSPSMGYNSATAHTSTNSCMTGYLSKVPAMPCLTTTVASAPTAEGSLKPYGISLNANTPIIPDSSTHHLRVFKKILTSTAATGITHGTPSKVMMTMNISMAANISQRCPMHTTSTYTASFTTTESTVSKTNPCGINNTSFHTLALL